MTLWSIPSVTRLNKPSEASRAEKDCLSEHKVAYSINEGSAIWKLGKVKITSLEPLSEPRLAGNQDTTCSFVTKGAYEDALGVSADEGRGSLR